MNFNLWKIGLIVLLSFVFPTIGKCQDIINKSNSELDFSLSNNSQELPLTLSDAVYLTLQNNRELKVAYLQRILDQTQLAEAESQFNPTFTPELSVSYRNNQNAGTQISNKIGGLNANLNWKIPTGANIGLTWQSQTNTSANSSIAQILSSTVLSHNVNFIFSQPFLKGFGTELNTISIKKAQLTEKANVLNLKNTTSQLITNTILNYRALLLAQERLKIEKISIQNANKDLERLQALFEFGRIPKNDLIERQADIAQQEVNLVTTQSNLDQAITNLTKILDLPITKKLVAIEIPIPPEALNLPNYEEMVKLAFENNSSYLNSLNGAETAKLNLIESENLQEFDLRFNLTYGFNSANNTQDIADLSTSLTLKREFGNFSQDHAVEKSQTSLQIANLTLENTRKNLEEELKTKIRNIEDSFRQIKLAQQARQLAETRVINAKERKRLGGNISLTDIINFEKGLVDAKNQELTAIINHLNSVAQLDQFLGSTNSKWSAINKF